MKFVCDINNLHLESSPESVCCC